MKLLQLLGTLVTPLNLPLRQCWAATVMAVVFCGALSLVDSRVKAADQTPAEEAPQADPDDDKPPDERYIVCTIAISPDGKSMASGGAQLCIWDTNTGNEIRRLEKGKDRVASVAFSHDGRLLASGGDDGAVRFWDLATGQVIRRLPYPGQVTAISISPDGRLLATGGVVERTDGLIQVWNLEAGRLDRTLRIPHGYASHMTDDLIFYLDSALLLSGDVEGLHMWDVDRGNEVPRFPKGVKVSSLGLSPDGKVLATACRYANDPIRLWDFTTGKELRTLQTRILLRTNGPFNTYVGAHTPNSLYIKDVVTGYEPLASDP